MVWFQRVDQKGNLMVAFVFVLLLGEEGLPGALFLK
jgi:hypothetical protein